MVNGNAPLNIGQIAIARKKKQLFLSQKNLCQC